MTTDEDPGYRHYVCSFSGPIFGNENDLDGKAYNLSHLPLELNFHNSQLWKEFQQKGHPVRDSTCLFVLSPFNFFSISLCFAYLLVPTPSQIYPRVEITWNTIKTRIFLYNCKFITQIPRTFMYRCRLQRLSWGSDRGWI